MSAVNKLVIERRRCSDNTVVASLVLDQTKKLSLRDFNFTVMSSHVSSPIPLRDPLAMNIGGYVGGLRLEFRLAVYDSTLYTTITDLLTIGKTVDVDVNYRVALIDASVTPETTLLEFLGALKSLSVKVSPGAGATNILTVTIEMMEGACR